MGRSTRTGSRGFTIIELMVVLALIVILASLAMVQYRRTIIY
jgi:prepilin-type N-terminal cleavage/methylation domain-containing protein